MKNFRQVWIETRRLTILRFVVEAGGEMNEGMLWRALQHGGFSRDSRSDLTKDLEHLTRQACLTDDWLGSMRVLKITRRGEDAAHGRGDPVEGIEFSRWER